VNQQISEELDKRIQFHQRWRRIWSGVYFTSSATTVISAALATASAGFITSTGGGKLLTASLALAATVFASLEKVLKMREKWDLHRNSQVALEIVKLKSVAGSDEAAKALVSQIEKVAQSYSLQLAELNEAPATHEAGE
jgi:hypothetical protein